MGSSKTSHGALPATLHVRTRSNGEPAARAYVSAPVPQPTALQDDEDEPDARVVITDPRQTRTLTSADSARRSGPRDPEEKQRRASKAAEIVKDHVDPDPRGRPIGMRVTEIDPELVLEILREQTAREAIASKAPEPLDLEDPTRRHE